MAEEDVGELNYREVQHKLKALGLPAKGPDKVLRERLASALDGTYDASQHEDDVPEVEIVRTEKSTKKTTSPKVEVKITTTKSPTKSPRSPKGRKSTKEPKEDEAKPEADDSKPEQRKSRRQSNKRESLTKDTPRSPPPTSRKRAKANTAHDVSEAEPFTPVDKIKRIARDSTRKVRKSLGNLNKGLKKRGIPWRWILPALLAALLLGSQWRHSMYWHRQLNHQMESLNSGLASLAQQTSTQANRIGHKAADTYDYLYRQTSHSADRLYDGVSGTYQWALQRLPLHHKLPESACSAKLNTTKLEELLFSTSSPLFSLSTTLADVWRGHKEHPLKATGVLLAGHDREHLDYAAQVIKAAVPAECGSCYLHLKGEDFSKAKLTSAGTLQAMLSSHISSCPYAIVHIEHVNKIHPEILSVLINAMSEQGALTTLGKSIATHNSLFIGSTQVPPEIFTKDGEEEFTAAVKRDLAFQLEMQTDATRLAIPEAFRRRWDYVAPILKQVS